MTVFLLRCWHLFLLLNLCDVCAANFWIFAPVPPGNTSLWIIRGIRLALVCALIPTLLGWLRASRPYLADIPVPRGPRIVFSIALSVAAFNIVFQVTIYPATNVGMFEENHPRYQGEVVRAPDMYVDTSTDPPRVVSLRRAGTWFAGKMKINEGQPMVWSYFRFRHTDAVQKEVGKWAERSGLGPLQLSDVRYRIDQEFTLIDVIPSNTTRTADEGPMDGRTYE